MTLCVTSEAGNLRALDDLRSRPRLQQNTLGPSVALAKLPKNGARTRCGRSAES